MVIWVLKLEMSIMLDDTAKVRFAATDCPGLSRAPSLFQVRVIGPFADVGVQLLVVMFKARERPLLVFLR
jgi:hypothetical protein